MVPALEATLADFGVDLHAQRNVELDLEDRPNKTPRAFCVPIEIPEPRDARDQAAGRPRRLARALPRGRAHRALRAHVGVAVGRRAAARRQRRHRGLGDAARAPHDRAGVAQAAARRSAAARVRRGRRDAAALDPAPLLREADLRARVPHGGRRDDDAPALRRAARRRAQGDAERHGLPCGHRRRVLLVAVPARVGVRGAVALVPAREVRQRVVHRRDAGSLIRELWSEGQKPTADELLREVTGAEVELEAAAERVRESLAAV